MLETLLHNKNSLKNTGEAMLFYIALSIRLIYDLLMNNLADKMQNV